LAVGLAAIVALVVASDPVRLVGVIGGFRLVLLPPILLLSIGFYVMQGLQWHVLLREVKVRIRLIDTLILNQTGQVSALLPLGEATRALLVARAADAPLGATMATITVQELIYAGLLLLTAIPGALQFRALATPVIVAFFVVVAIFVILIVDPVFEAVMQLVIRIPVIRRVDKMARELQLDSELLLANKETYLWAWLALARAIVGIAVLWLVVEAIAPGHLAWTQVAFVYSIAQIVSAISLSPGGLGTLEAGTTGLLVAVGMPFQDATAAAILQRLCDKGFGTLTGLVLFVWVRKRYHFEGEALFSIRPSGAPSTTG